MSHNVSGEIKMKKLILIGAYLKTGNVGFEIKVGLRGAVPNSYYCLSNSEFERFANGVSATAAIMLSEDSPQLRDNSEKFLAKYSYSVISTPEQPESLAEVIKLMATVEYLEKVGEISPDNYNGMQYMYAEEN
jgi:hypothetical protein